MDSVVNKKITPNMFFSEEPPERTIGVECEYVIQGMDSAGNVHPSSEYISKQAINNAGIRAIGQYTELGSRIYPDVGLAEHCTPECLGPYQAAAADIASIAIMASIVESSGIEHKGLYRISGTSLIDTTTAASAKFTNGVHENFMAPLEISHNKLLVDLIPTYYATRVATMAGTVSRNKYEFSQKAKGIGGAPIERSLSRRTSAGDKPMALILSSESDTVGSGWLRLETRFVDAPSSLASRRHALATTSLMLRIAEHEGIFREGSFDDIIIKDPVGAAHQFMSDLTLKSTVEVRSGKQMTMLDIGEKLAKKVLYLCERIKLPADELDAANTWPVIIDAFRRSNPAAVEYDDYLLLNYSVATKHYWLDRIGAFEKGDAEAKTRSLQWDRILPIGNGRALLEKSTIIVDPDVEKLQNSAPLTRAAIRADFIINNHEDPKATISGWNLGTLPPPIGVIKFSDPYGYID